MERVFPASPYLNTQFKYPTYFKNILKVIMFPFLDYDTHFWLTIKKLKKINRLFVYKLKIVHRRRDRYLTIFFNFSFENEIGMLCFLNKRQA